VTEAAKYRLASEIIMVIALIGIMKLGLLGALLPGLLIYEIVHAMVPPLRRMGITHDWVRTVALAIPALIIGTALIYGVVELVVLATGSESLVDLLRRMADIVEAARRYVPIWAQGYLPENIVDIQNTLAQWLREHAGQVGTMGQTVGRVMFHIIIGLVIGGMLAVRSGINDRPLGPLATEMENRAATLASAFRNVVFSQIRISALNTVLTAIYLMVILPSFGVHLPLLKTMIAVTFIAGLIPILGNLISNTMICIVGLSVSPVVAAASLAYLILIHKLEYFMNARIIGGQIKARAWELLAALLVMEAMFGIPGLIAAPIYYAYFKDELTARRLI
jgi:predicted PurR-regulated permease PerM